MAWLRDVDDQLDDGLGDVDAGVLLTHKVDVEEVVEEGRASLLPEPISLQDAIGLWFVQGPR